MLKQTSIFFASLLCIGGLLAGCSDHKGSSGLIVGSPVVVEEDSLPGMLRVSGSNSFVFLGTNGKSARAIERPRMRVNFDYDFSLGKSEVTCGEFNELQKSVLTLDCESSSQPASNVTYYDAVLFANAKSKSLHMDTAYTYSSANFDGNGHCTNLEGFLFHPEVNAFRLPTEAEWTLAANSDWNPKDGWNAENSDYKKHDVCSRQADSAGFCDMAGNVMEWMNDWLGTFADTSIYNYVGAPDGGTLGQRVVKGGSYRDAAGAMTLYSRGDVYTVTSATKADYVGFRLAYGAIPDAVWMNGNGESSASRVVPLVSSPAIKNLFGTYKTKLVFRNDATGNLNFIDFSSGVVSVVEIKDTIDAYHPVISPDGRKVAFCTGMEGVSGKSSLFVRDLNSSGSNLVKLEVESAAIPRWKIFNGDTSIVFVTDAGNNKDSQTFLSQSTWKVSFSDGKFGTPEKLLDGAYHGGVSDDVKFAVTGARLLRAFTAGKDTIWYNGEQSCNVSLSKDGLKRTLFLDFGSSTGKEFVGSSYGVHEQVLIADSAGRLIQSYSSPSNYAFDHTEWASDNLIVATLTNVNGAHEKIVLVNTLDSSVTEIAEGDELWHPDFWYKASGEDSEESLLNFDSAGVYFTPDIPYYGLELRIKMESFWTQKDEATVIALGSSRTMFGVNADFVKSEKLINMAYSSGDFPGIYYLFVNYVAKHSKAKTVVIEFSPDFLITDANSSWNPVYQVVPGFLYDEKNNFWPDGVSEAFVNAVKDSYKPLDILTLPYDPDEFLLPSNGWGNADLHRDSSTIMKIFGENISANMSLLREIVQLAQEKNIKVVVLIPPQNPGYKNTGAFGMYGISRSHALSLIDSVKQMDVILFDENKMGNHDYTDDMAFNTDHLSRLGAKQLSSRLDSLLSALK